MANNTEAIAHLIKDKEEFKSKVADQLAIGHEYLTRNVATREELQQCWDEFIDWDYYNQEMIRQAFDIPDNVYAEEYKRFTGGFGITFPGSYKPPSFQESVESNRKEMRHQVRKLKTFLNKIELLRVKPGLIILKPVKEPAVDKLIALLKRFHKVAQELRERRAEREPLVIKDEYDVQYLLNALLKLHFDDVRQEEFSPSNSGANTRLDFVLKNEGIVLETKMPHEKLKPKTLGEELLIDIGRYKAYPGITDLVIFIYDKADHITNKRGFSADLEKQSTPEIKVSVVIIPD
jgi:hypothetical protein